MTNLRRIRYKGWFIQSRESSNLPGQFIAWSSKLPSDDVHTAPDPVFFGIANTEMAAIAEVQADLDVLQRAANELFGGES